MPESTRDLRIRRFRPLVPPAILLEELPLSDAGSVTVMRGRADVVRFRRDPDLLGAGMGIVDAADHGLRHAAIGAIGDGQQRRAHLPGR